MPFYWWRRLRTAPLSIKIAVAAFGLWGAVALFGVALEALQLSEDGNPRLLIWAAQLSLCAYVIIGTARMSRLPIAVLAVVLAAELFDQVIAGRLLRLLGVQLVAFIGFVALVTPHWRGMSWRPFGEEPPIEPRLEDLFD
jgi:hypothetical protein